VIKIHPLLILVPLGCLALIACARSGPSKSSSPASAPPAAVVCHLDEHMPGCAEPWAITAFGLFQGGTVHASARRMGEQDLEITIMTRTVDASVQCRIRIHGEATGPTATAEVAEVHADGATEPKAYSGDIRLVCFPFPKGAAVDCEVTLMRPGSAPLELYQACVQATVE
jgi:hypothetical protein